MILTKINGYDNDINNKITIDNFLSNFFNSCEDFFIGDSGLFSGENGYEIYKGKEGEYMIDMAIPGYKKEDIILSIDKTFLKISRKKEQEGGRKYSYGFVDRQWIIPKNADIDNISAELADGILTIKLPKTEEKKTTKIVEIK